MAIRFLRLSVCLAGLPLMLVACTSSDEGELTDEAASGLSSHVCPSNTVEGVDVSHSIEGTVNWTRVAQSGIKFAFIKATQGTYNTQTDFAGDWARAKSAGLLRGAYHFFDPTQDGAAQAAHFLAVLGNDYGELPITVDLECPNGDSRCLGGRGAGNASSASITPRVHQFLSAVTAKTGRKPIIYTDPGFAKSGAVSTTGLEAYPLWIATISSSCAAVPSPWKAAAFWQWTWHGSVPGISGDVDRDRFIGTLADLRKFAQMNSAPTPDGGGASGGAMKTGAGGCHPGGLYCGGDKVTGDSNTLYRCASDATGTVVMQCPNGCALLSGANDACN